MPEPLQRYPVNETNRARLGSRRVQGGRPFPAGAGTGRVRLRSKAAARVFALARGHGRVRLRSNASGGFPEEMVLVLTGQVWVAPVGTPGPTSVSSALHSAFKDMGFISEEGVKFTEDRQVEARFSWTSLYPKELVVVGRTATVEFALREFNKRAVEFALEGSVTSNGAEWKHDAFNAAAVSKALVIDAADGSSLVRLYFPSGVVEADVESGHSRAGSTDLPVAFSSDRATTDPYTLWRTGVK